MGTNILPWTLPVNLEKVEAAPRAELVAWDFDSYESSSD